MLPTAELLAGYEPRTTVRDELLRESGGVREHWSGLVSGYETLGVTELLRRRAEIQLLLEQEGVTYNVASERPRPSRPWSLDPIPLIVPVDEWSVLEQGTIQRAELLDLVLTDLYGERRLLRSGAIPAEMILSDPQFVRACDGITVPGEKQLIVAATDLARCSDGSWRAIGQRTQAPSGAAYALENRRVVSRVFPKLFRDAAVQRLSPFIEALRRALLAAAPAEVEDPSIVILSPGSLSETAFEHASIAAQLGYPLVQGSDFELRQGQVGLRTVGGWVPVHVILRRVDATFCDPLALRPNSTLGIPGLVDACRAGVVSVVNTLGSGILENAGLAGLMARLSKDLLGSDLILDSVPSWWCGDDVGRSHVLANLEAFVLRPLSRMSLQHSIDTRRASRAELDELRRRIVAQPGQWVGQERVQPGSGPVLTDRGIEPRPTVLRTFVIAHADSYTVMPGGLARTATRDPEGPITNRTGAKSKDTWVLRTESQEQLEFWPTELDRETRSPVEALPARAAEHLFWLGRYAERAEATVRLIRTVNAQRDEFQDTPAGPGPAALTVLLEALTRITGTFPGFVGDDAEALFDDPTDELFSLVVDERRAGTIAHAIGHMFDAIDVVRDQLSLDTWLVIGSLQRELDRISGHADLHKPAPDGDDRDEAMTNVLNNLLHGLLSLSGLANESMVRDQGWQFMETGRRIERASHASILVGSMLGTERSAPVERLVLESALTAGESIITSRRRYRSQATAWTAINLLYGDAGNPRSLIFQLDRLAESLPLLGAHSEDGSLSVARQLFAELEQMVAATDWSRLAETDDRGQRGELESFAFAVQSLLARISNAVAAEFFTRLQPQLTIATSPSSTPGRPS